MDNFRTLNDTILPSFNLTTKWSSLERLMTLSYHHLIGLPFQPLLRNKSSGSFYGQGDTFCVHLFCLAAV
jgi:hypothetical protein